MSVSLYMFPHLISLFQGRYFPIGTNRMITVHLCHYNICAQYIFLHPPGTTGTQGSSAPPPPPSPVHSTSPLSRLWCPPSMSLISDFAVFSPSSRQTHRTWGRSGSSQSFRGIEVQRGGGAGLGQTTTEPGRPLSSPTSVPTAPNTAHTCWKGQALIDNRAPAITLLFLSGWKSPVPCVCECVSVCECVCRKWECFFFPLENKEAVF